VQQSAVERQCRRRKVPWNTFRQQPHAGQVQEREGQPVQRLYRRKRREPGGLGQHRPAHDPGSSGEYRGARWAKTVEQGAADKEEHHHLGRDRQGPQQSGGAWADPCGTPADDGKAVVQRVAAEDQCRDQNNAAVKRQPQQRSDPAEPPLEFALAAGCRRYCLAGG
jgi:hypothetical protein